MEYTFDQNWQCVEVWIWPESGPARQKHIWHFNYIIAPAWPLANADTNGNFSGTDEVGDQSVPVSLLSHAASEAGDEGSCNYR